MAKYEQLGQLPSEREMPRQYRTRTDPFTADWPIIEAMLVDAPGLEAKALFGWLCGRLLAGSPSVLGACSARDSLLSGKPGSGHWARCP